MVDGLGRMARQSFHARAGLTTLHGIWRQALCAGRECTRHLRPAALTQKTTINASTYGRDDTSAHGMTSLLHAASITRSFSLDFCAAEAQKPRGAHSQL